MRSKAALACLITLFVMGSIAVAEDAQIRFLHKGTVMTNVPVTVLNQDGSVLNRLMPAGDGIYSVPAELGQKLLFSVHQPLTGADVTGEALVTELGAIIDVDLTQPAPDQVCDNDLCVNAIPVAVPSLTVGSTIGCTIDSEYPFCGTGITSPGNWYSFTGTGTLLIASTCENSSAGSANYDTKISIYCLDCDPAQVVCVDGNDDESGCNFHSTVDFETNAGASYFMLIHGFGGASGDYAVDLIDTGIPSQDPLLCFPPPPEGPCCNCNAPPFNCQVTTEDDCAELGGQYFGDDFPCVIPDPPIVYASAPGLPFGGQFGTPTVISDTITVPDSIVITDVNIQLEITHTWVGDMIIDIEHNGLVQTIWLGVCGSTQNLNATADDEGTETYCTVIAGGPPDAVFYPPDLAGTGPLSIYDGLDAIGDWTITITDTFPSLDDGVLDAWAVVLPSGPGVAICPDQNDETCFLCGVGDDEDEDAEGGGGDMSNRDLTAIGASDDSQMSANTNRSQSNETRNERRKLDVGR